MTQRIKQWSQTKSAWGLLFLSAFALLCAALYFQHVLGHAPCIKCIYQRTAMIGILLAGLLPLIHNNALSRALAYALWLLSAFWGGAIATEQLDLLNAANSFFASCDIVPNFPSFMPLHDWLPNIFSAPGDCFDQRWQFLGLGMAQWMQYIFAAYCLVALLMVSVQFNRRR